MRVDMKKKTVTKNEVQVLYQFDYGITAPQEIADILPKLELKEVKETLKTLREKKLIRGQKATEEGKETLKKRHKWAFG